MKLKECLHCNNLLNSRQFKYCSNFCQVNFQNELRIKEWKNGEWDGADKGQNKNLSKLIRKYLIEKYNNSCVKCGWDEINTFTNKSPLEIEHIDGNSRNNNENNLTVLCPNCHSLTSTYKALNKGNGRKYRRDKYRKDLLPD